MSIFLHKRLNVTILLYYIVCPAKYSKIEFSEEADNTMKDICLEIAEYYEINFL